jgi:hypothetical protein
MTLSPAHKGESFDADGESERSANEVFNAAGRLYCHSQCLEKAQHREHDELVVCSYAASLCMASQHGR